MEITSSDSLSVCLSVFISAVYESMERVQKYRHICFIVYKIGFKDAVGIYTMSWCSFVHGYLLFSYSVISIRVRGSKFVIIYPTGTLGTRVLIPALQGIML